MHVTLLTSEISAHGTFQVPGGEGGWVRSHRVPSRPTFDASDRLSAVLDLVRMLEEGVQRRVGGRLVVDDVHDSHDCACEKR